MTLRCIKCNRTLLRFTVSIPSRDGVIGWGPQCSRSVTISRGRKQRRAVPQAIKQPLQADPNQLTLELA